jgi:hypothetical protein
MPRKAKPVDIEKIETTRSWCLTVFEFVRPEFPEDIYSGMLQMVDTVFDGRKAREIQDVVVAAKEIGDALSPARQQQLNDLLQSRFGWTLRDESKADLKRLRNLLKKGRLRSDDEFRFIQEYLNDQDKTEFLTAAEVTEINKLLIAHETR